MGRQTIRSSTRTRTFKVPSKTGDVTVSVNSKREIEFGPELDLEYERSMVEFGEEPSECLKIYYVARAREEVKERICLSYPSGTMSWKTLNDLVEFGLIFDDHFISFDSQTRAILALTMSAKGRYGIAHRDSHLKPEHHALIIDSIRSKKDKAELVCFSAQLLGRELTSELARPFTDQQRAMIALNVDFNLDTEDEYIKWKNPLNRMIVPAPEWNYSADEFIDIVLRGDDAIKQVAARHFVLIRLNETSPRISEGTKIKYDAIFKNITPRVFELIDSIRDADIKFTTLCDYGTAFKEIIEDGLSDRFYKIFDKSLETAWTLEKYEMYHGQKLPIRHEHAIIPRLPSRNEYAQKNQTDRSDVPDCA